MRTDPPKFKLAHPNADHPASREGAGQAVTGALRVLSDISMAGLALVPREPSAEMLAAGARAAGVSTAVVNKAWHAILDASQ